MNQTRYPKILIISNNALSMHSNNGKTLYSLFKNWNPENIAQFYFYDEKPESDKFSKYFRITDTDIIKHLFNFYKTKDCGSEVSITLGEPLLDKINPTRQKIINVLRNNLFFLVMVRNLIFKLPFWNSSNLNNWIDSFKPDGIFLLGGNYKFPFRIANKLSKQYGIPLYIYITDDYILNKSASGFFSNFQKKLLIKTYRYNFNYAKRVFVIGQLMAKEFGEFFNLKFIPIMNLIEIERYNNISVSTKNDKLTIVYIGGIHLNRWKQLVSFGELIAPIAKKLNIEIQVEVYTVTPPSDDIINLLSVYPLSYKGKLLGDDVIIKMKSADILLHVESDEPKYRELTRLSVSTKISEYCACAKCIIGYGPQEVASMRLIKDNNIGLVLSNELSSTELEAELIKVLSDEHYRNNLGQTAYQFVLDNFEAKNIRNIFLSYFL